MIPNKLIIAKLVNHFKSLTLFRSNGMNCINWATYVKYIYILDKGKAWQIVFSPYNNTVNSC